MIDFHSHILPNIDDGADSVETSLEMLRKSKEQGVSDIVATPHFYYDETTVKHFWKNRQKAYETLMNAIGEEELPEIHLGCEVHLDSKLKDMKDLEMLCLEGTEFILLEMPFGLWQSWMNETVYHIIAQRKLIPVIAHVDRYSTMLKQFERMQTLLSLDVVIQLNADAFLYRSMNRKIKKILGLNRPVVLGSDMHNMTDRQSKMDVAGKKIEKKFGSWMLQSMEENATRLLENRLPLSF